jgi:membrane protease YdiL (CAAX protease family)
MPPQPPPDPVLNSFIYGTLLLSILTGLYLLAARRRGPLLTYEPRRPVPWNVAACVLAVLFVLFTFAARSGAAATGETEVGHEVMASAGDLIFQLLTTLFIVGGFLTVVALLSNATRVDLGFPRGLADAPRDVAIGMLACLAALAPVLISQTILKLVFFPDDRSSGHPLIKLMTSGERNMEVLILGGVFAVIVAPICEEISFRLLLQGWLEKFEDRYLGTSREVGGPPATVEEAPIVDAKAAPPMEPAPAVVEPSMAPIVQEPPAVGLFGLPHGWFPILVSSTLFGLAHFGYGPEPLPLILLGLVLGYLYQRTHRILPGIVTHALFNLFSMTILWRMILHASAAE